MTGSFVGRGNQYIQLVKVNLGIFKISAAILNLSFISKRHRTILRQISVPRIIRMTSLWPVKNFLFSKYKRSSSILAKKKKKKNKV